MANTARVEQVFESSAIGVTDPDIVNATGIPYPSVRRIRRKLQQRGVIVASGTRDGSTLYRIVPHDQRDRAAVEFADRCTAAVVASLAKQVLALDPKDRAKFHSKLREDKRERRRELDRVRVDQRRGNGTPVDHVRTCTYDALFAVDSMLQQNGPKSPTAWLRGLDDDDRDDIVARLKTVAELATRMRRFLEET